MLKMLLCLLCGSATAVALLELRQQRLDLTFQTNKLHNQIEASQMQTLEPAIVDRGGHLPQRPGRRRQGQRPEAGGGKRPGQAILGGRSGCGEIV